MLPISISPLQVIFAVMIYFFLVETADYSYPVIHFEDIDIVRTIEIVLPADHSKTENQTDIFAEAKTLVFVSCSRFVSKVCTLC